MKNLIFLFAILLFVFSCSKDASDHNTFSLTLDQGVSIAYTSLPTPIKIDLQRNDNYGVIVSQLEGRGGIVYNEQKISDDSLFYINADEFSAMYFPTQIGKHKINLEFSNNTTTKDIIYEIDVPETSLNITHAYAEGDSLFLNKPFYINFILNSPIDSFCSLNANIDILKGEAVSYFNDSLTSISPGQHSILYHPHSIGRHELKISLENKYGYSEAFDFYFDVSSPGYSFSLNADTLIAIGENLLDLTIDCYNEGEYRIDHHFTKNKGSLIINGVEYTEGQAFSMSTGKHSCKFITTEIGEGEIEFSISDQYGLSQKKNIKFNVVPSVTEIITNNLQHEIQVGKKYSFPLSIKNSFTTSLRCKLSSSPNKLEDISISGKKYSGEIINISSSEIITITPKTIGNVDLSISIYDDKDVETVKVIPFNISNPDLLLLINNSSSDIELGKSGSFTFTASKETEDSLYYHITVMPESCYFSVDGKPYSGKSNINSGSSVKVELFPEEIGDVEVTVSVSDQYEGLNEEKVIFHTMITPISLTVHNHSSESILNTENSCYFSVQKKNYTGSFKYRIETDPISPGTIKINNAVYNGSKEPLVYPEKTILSYSSSYSGSAKVTLFIYDEYDNETFTELEYSVVNPPLGLTHENINKQIQIGEIAKINFTPTKSNYHGKFFCEIISDHCDKIKLNSIEYRGKTELNKTNNLVTFLPTGVGQDVAKITLKLTDEWGGVYEKELSFSVDNPPIDLSVIASEDVLDLGKERNFIFIADKSSKDSISYKLTLDPSDIGELSKTTGKVAPGSPVNIIFNSKKEGIAKITVTASDQYGGKQSKIIQVPILNTPISLTAQNFSSESILNSENTCYFIVEKDRYQGNFKYNISTTPEDAGVIKVNGQTYSSGEVLLSNPAYNKLSFFPKVSGDVKLSLTIKDDYNGSVTHDFNYDVEIPIGFSIRKIPVYTALSKTEQDYSDHEIFLMNLQASFDKITTTEGEYNLGVKTIFSSAKTLHLPFNQKEISQLMGEISIPTFEDKNSDRVDYSFSLKAKADEMLKIADSIYIIAEYKDGTSKIIDKKKVPTAIEEKISSSISTTEIDQITSLTVKSVIVTQYYGRDFPEYYTLPARFVFEREEKDEGMYSIQCTISYVRYPYNIPSPYTVIGDADFKLLPNDSETTLIKELDNVSLRLTSNFNTLCHFRLKCTIKWEDSPLRRGVLGYRIIASDGEILGEGLYKSIDYNGFYEGIIWTGGEGDYEQVFIDDTDKLETARIEYYYSIKK